jgi:hypothetical protein
MAEVAVYRGSGPVECGFVIAALEAEGVQFLIKTPHGISKYPFSVGPMAEFVVFVDNARAEDTRTLLDSLQASVDTDPSSVDPHGYEGQKLFFKPRRDVTRSEMWVMVASVGVFTGLGFTVSGGRVGWVMGAVVILVSIFVGVRAWRKDRLNKRH